MTDEQQTPTETPTMPPQVEDAPPAASLGAGPGTLCTLATEDDAGFTSLSACLVLEVFAEPDDDGNEVQLARIAVLPDERIAHVARLRPFVSTYTESD